MIAAALRSKDAFSSAGLARRSAPFLGLLLLGFALFAVGSPRHWWYFAAALALAAAACLLAVLLPWPRLPDPIVVAPPLLLVAAIALLRQGQGGSLSGYGALFLIPTLWVACYGTRTELALILAALVLSFWLPIALVGGHSYPASQWRSGGLLVLIVGLFGLVIQQLIASLLAEQTRRLEAEQQLREARAYEIHDDIVQDLTVAQLALALNAPARAADAIDQALHVAQAIVSDLLPTRPHATPGSLVRKPTPADGRPQLQTAVAALECRVGEQPQASPLD
jgi:signal transduction histidine kinase